MNIRDLKIGIGLTGSFCTFEKILPEMEKMISEGAQIVPIMSYTAASTDTRFGKIQDIKDRIKSICNRDIVETIVDAEPLGPNNMIDIMVIAPCTPNIYD